MATKLSEVIKDKDSWIKKKCAANSDGVFVSYTDPEATKFCLIGAIAFMTSKPCEGSTIPGCRMPDYTASLEAAGKLAKIIRKKTKSKEAEPFEIIADFNDDPETKFKDIQAVIKEFEK